LFLKTNSYKNDLSPIPTEKAPRPDDLSPIPTGFSTTRHLYLPVFRRPVTYTYRFFGDLSPIPTGFPVTCHLYLPVFWRPVTYTYRDLSPIPTEKRPDLSPIPTGFLTTCHL